MAHESEIGEIETFHRLVLEHEATSNELRRMEARRAINQTKTRVRTLVVQAGVFKEYSVVPPPIIGGPIVSVDAFNAIFDRVYNMNMVPALTDMLDEAVGAIKAGALDKKPSNEPAIVAQIRQGYAFIAMPIDPSDPLLEDVLDTIKQAAKNCGIDAERVDDQKDNSRITDRIISSIDVAEFVIADLSSGRPNVFWEAGYAHGVGKVPIYVARLGTKLEFDVKDYPVIFFENNRSLRQQLEERLRSLIERR